MTADTDRRFTIGGSDCAAAAGVHPYLSPIMLWAQKTGLVPGPDSEAMEWGTRLQPVVFDALRDRGYEVAEYVGNPLVNAEREWVTGSPDGFVTTDGDAVLEVKTVGTWQHRHGWDAEIPPHYVAQGQWYMLLTGLERCVFAVLIGGQKLEVHTVNRSDHAIRLLLRECEKFYACLVANEPPAPDGSESSRDALTAMFPQADDGGIVRLDSIGIATLDDLRMLREQRDILDRQVAKRENTLRALMGSAERAIDSHDVEVVRWTNTTTRRIDTKRLKADRPDIAGEYTTETASRRFTIV